MIFRQIPQILQGKKTQTRRVCKPNEEAVIWPNPDIDYAPLDYADEVVIKTAIPGTTGEVTRSKWAIGRTYAVVPKRGMPGVVWGKGEPGILWWSNPATAEFLADYDYQPLRIRITAIRKERLQDITEADARAEGVESIEAYRALWDSINGKTKGARWDDSPLVWALTFEVVRS